MRKKVVTLGAGTGQASLLPGFAATPWEVTSVVGVTDNGGHSGSLRKVLGIPQVGDFRNCLESLIGQSLPWSELLQTRFTDGDLAGVHLGNLMVAALVQKEGAFSRAAMKLHADLALPVCLLPASDANLQVCADLSDGSSQTGEWEILKRGGDTVIERIFLSEPASACNEVQTRISEADLLVICPGSLLTGVTPQLLLEGMQEALSRVGKIVYLANAVTQPGQTDGWNLRQHVEWIERQLERKLDAVFVHEGPVIEELLEEIGAVRVNNDLGQERTVVAGDLLRNSGDTEVHRPGVFVAGPHPVRHCPNRTLAALTAWFEA